MPRLKFCFVFLFVSLCVSAFGQTPGTVFMKWKLKPDEVISYKAYMKEKDTSAQRFDIGKVFNAPGADSSARPDNDAMQKIMRQMQSLTPEFYDVKLTGVKGGVVNVEMFANMNKKNNVDTAQLGLAQMMNAMASGPMLRGALTEDGAIKSFYIAGGQLNILALFFQLPAKPVKLGDQWQLDTHFISTDQNFKCDSSYRSNVVKVTGIQNADNDKIVTISYNIVEYAGGDFSFPFAPPGIGVKKEIPSIYKFVFKATARFSIAKGRWLSYEGELESATTGFMESSSKQRYALVP